MIVFKDILQIGRALAAAFVDAVVFARVAARVIVIFEVFVVAERKTALLLIFELVGRQLEIVSPEHHLAG